jgi:hypothetical protein
MEVIKRVARKEDNHVAQTWLKNNQPNYSWYRSFLNKQGDIAAAFGVVLCVCVRVCVCVCVKLKFKLKLFTTCTG